ncbi:MAG: methylmalonyl-CoA mutase [Acidobacteria bacterium]|nr:methylmalonyl-CoA mutase [Acidobacteriota bacterium]
MQTTRRAPSQRKAAKIVYRPEDVAELDYAEHLGDPGQFPFTRGIHPEMYGSRLWTMRQYAGYATAEESNRRYRYLLSQGTSGLSVAFDLPTQIGLDSDHPLAVGEVGRVGVAIDSLDDMERLFEGIPLDQISTSMTINATAAILLALYVAVARKQKVSPSQLRGTVQNDILKEYIARGTYIYPPRPSLRLVTDVFAYCQEEMPRWNTISISGYHIREAGSTAAQELAFTLANAETYVSAALEASLKLDDFAPQLSFFFNAHNDLFEEVAKFRAARKLWARIMRDRFGAQRKESWMLRFHTQTAGSTLTAQQPDNNVIRITVQALAAILGGTQSLHTNARDEALALPTQEAARLALRTQQVLAYESGVARVADPLGGSWYLESLTLQLEFEAQEYLEKIRSMGGMLRAIETEYVQNEIRQAAYAHQKRLEAGEEIMVGVNLFDSEGGAPIEILKVDPEIETRQIERLQRLRQTRAAAAVTRALDKVRETARGGENLVPAIIGAVEAYATVGEIADVLRDVFGEHREGT